MAISSNPTSGPRQHTLRTDLSTKELARERKQGFATVLTSANGYSIPRL
jgi:hypothetical protein